MSKANPGTTVETPPTQGTEVGAGTTVPDIHIATHVRAIEKYVQSCLERSELPDPVIGPICVAVSLTPTVAEFFWGRNTGNYRKPTPSQVSKLISDLNNSNWDDLNGANLGFDTKGVLSDGQKRALAVIESGKTMRTFVCFNLVPEKIDNIDRNEKRTLAQDLARKGESEASTLAAVLPWVFDYERDQLLPVASGAGSGGVARSVRDLLSVLDNNPDIRVAMNAKSPSAPPYAKNSVAIFFYWLILQEDEDTAKEFIEKFTSGEELSKTDETSGIFLLRKRLEDNERKTIGKLRSKEKLALMVKAWNSFCRANVVKMLSWKPRTETFPIVLNPEV